MKKGFTLIELIACIALMAMLSTIIINISIKKINETKLKSRELLVESIELAAKQYVTEKNDILTDFRDKDYIYVTLKTLIEDNKLSNNLLDQTTNKNLPLTDVVYVTKSYNSKITATYDINQNSKSSIVLKGAYNIYLDIDEAYIEPGIIATSIDNTNITSNVASLGTVNTSTEGIYVLTYTVNNQKVTRNIIVGDINYLTSTEVMLIIQLDGGITTNDQSDLYSPTQSITLDPPTRDNYIFNGWKKISGNSVLSGNKVTMGTTRTIIKAQWLSNTHTISYNCNEGQGFTPNSTHIYNQTTHLTKNGCYKYRIGSKGIVYNFAGWGTKKDDILPKFNDYQTISSLPNEIRQIETLYAIWKPLFTYTGDYEILDDNNENWNVKLKSNGRLTFLTSTNLDIFLVGGGGGASGGYGDAGGYLLGAGGGGGYTNTYSNISIEENSIFEIKIGQGGDGCNGSCIAKNGEETKFQETTTLSGNINYITFGGVGAARQNGGDGGNGGSAGAKTDSSEYNWTGGNSGISQAGDTYEFNDSTRPQYAIGGIGGSSISCPTESNTGNGGCVWHYLNANGYSTGGGSGVSGIVIIRNARA